MAVEILDNSDAGKVTYPRSTFVVTYKSVIYNVV